MALIYKGTEFEVGDRIRLHLEAGTLLDITVPSRMGRRENTDISHLGFKIFGETVLPEKVEKLSYRRYNENQHLYIGYEYEESDDERSEPFGVMLKNRNGDTFEYETFGLEPFEPDNLRLPVFVNHKEDGWELYGVYY